MVKAAPVGTARILGIVVVAGGRALDLALVETDGADLVRRIETQRVGLPDGPLEATVVQAVRVFMGDRALQPFAVDRLALEPQISERMRGALEAGVGVSAAVALAPAGDVTFAYAERIALGAARPGPPGTALTT
jgi:hypothetical protein